MYEPIVKLHAHVFEGEIKKGSGVLRGHMSFEGNGLHMCPALQ